MRLYVGVNNLAELESHGQTFYAVNWQFREPLQEGSRGESVRTLQYILSVVGEFISSIPAVAIDGVFGPATRTAVAAFQQFARLSPDGIVNEATWDALYDQMAGIEWNTPFETNRFVPPEESPQTVSAQEDAVPAGLIIDSGQRITNADTAFLTQFPGQVLRYGDSDFDRRAML